MEHIIERSLNGTYLPADIASEIRTRMSRRADYRPVMTVHGKNRNAVLYVGFPPKQGHLLERIYQRLGFFADMFPHKEIRVVFFPTQHKKMLPKSKKASINVPHINSAMTTQFPHDPSLDNVIIYREEESPKVLCHELCHLLNLDVAFSRKDDDYFRRKYNLRTPCYLSEVYCEVVGTLLNLYDYASSDTRSHRMERFRELYTVERTYMLYKTAQILEHYDIHHPTDLHKLTSDTNTLTYTVMKCAYLLTVEREHDMVSFVKRLIDTKLYISEKTFREHIEDGFDRLFKECQVLHRIFKDSSPPPKSLDSTLRLTIVE